SALLFGLGPASPAHRSFATPAGSGNGCWGTPSPGCPLLVPPLSKQSSPISKPTEYGRTHATVSSPDQAPVDHLKRQSDNPPSPTVRKNGGACATTGWERAEPRRRRRASAPGLRVPLP